MQNAIILHGAPEKDNYYDPAKPSESNAHWLPWLQKELIIRDIKADTPEVPQSYEPQYALWCKEVERYEISGQTMLVGHSAGGGFWLRYLSEHAGLQVGKVVLVAPWLDPNKTLGEAFFAQTFDRQLAGRTAGLSVFHSPDDSDSVQKSLRRIGQEIDGISWHEFTGYGHFTYENLKTESFPELLQSLLS